MNDLIGRTFGKLTILDIKMTPTKDQQGKRNRCICRCECGSIHETDLYSVTSGRALSCGCGKRKSSDPNIVSRNLKEEYNAWNHAKHRCYDVNDDGYKYYGERGIRMCDRWLEERGFENFILDMGPKPEPKDGYSLDRIDGKGGYSPENCRWATTKEQQLNKDGIIYLTYNDKTQAMSEWAEELGINLATIRTRYYAGKSVEEILRIPREVEKRIKSATVFLTLDGITKSVPDWSLDTGIDIRTILSRKKAGWSDKDILSKFIVERRASGSIKSAVLTYRGESRTLGEWATFLGKNYDTLKGRYMSGMLVEDILSENKLEHNRVNVLQNKLGEYVGKHFGKLTIKGIIMKGCKGGRRSYAICDCACGVRGKEILLSNVVTGKQTSCGCGRGTYRPETVVSESKKYSIKNIVGKRFERLVVQEVLKENPAPNKYVYKLRCSCDCGNEAIINLTAWGVIKSCGCYRKETSKENRTAVTKEVINNARQELEAGFEKWPVAYSEYVGQKFNKLRVLEVRQKPTNTGGYKSYAKCLCDCGNTTIKFLSNVTRGHTKSCGCAKVDTANAMSYNNSAVVSGSKYCQVGDSFGSYVVKELIKKKHNLYARCSILGGGKEVDIAVGNLSKKGERVRGGSL